MSKDLFAPPPDRANTPSRKRPARECDVRTVARRIKDCADFEDIYKLASVLERPKDRRVGCPPHYPPYIWLLFIACRSVHGSARHCAASLQDPDMWNWIRQGVAKHLGQQEADRLPEIGPSRYHWQHAQKSVLLPNLAKLNEKFAQLALAQALRQDLLPPQATRSWSNPKRHQLIAGDGTVAKSPTLSTRPYTVDSETGEIIKCHRVDPAASLQAEGGSEKPDVLGTKFVFFSTRRRGYFRRVFLNYRHVPHGYQGGEASAALELACSILDEAEGCMGVLYDGALRGKHRDLVARRGRLVINRQHKGLRPQPLTTLEFDHCRHELWAADGRLKERTFLDDGTSILVPLPVRKFERRGTVTFRWYHLVVVPCIYGMHVHREPVGVTTAPGERAEGQSDLERDFHRAEHLQQIPSDSSVHESLYGGREDAESAFSQFDRSLWNGRLIAFGAEAQSLVVLGFMLAQNAISAARYVEDPTYSDGEEEVD